MSDTNPTDSPITDSPFSDDERQLLAAVPMSVGGVVAAVDKSGVMGIMKEAMASMRAGTEGIKDHPDNSLIQLASARSADGSVDTEAAEAMKAQAIERMKSGPREIEAISEKLVADSAAVADLLDEKADPNEAAEYKSWVVSVGKAVSEAAKEGGFLGIGGEQVSDKESDLLDRVAEALRV